MVDHDDEPPQHHILLEQDGVKRVYLAADDLIKGLRWQAGRLAVQAEDYGVGAPLAVAIDALNQFADMVDLGAMHCRSMMPVTEVEGYGPRKRRRWWSHKGQGDNK